MIRVQVRQKPGRALQLYYVDPLTGLDRTRSSNTHDWKEAERAAAKWEEEVAAGHAQANATWDQFRERFEDEHLPGLAPATRAAYGTALNAFEKWVGKARTMNGITVSVLSKFQAALLAADYPATSVACYLRHLKSALNWGQRTGLLTRAPSIKPPKTGTRKLWRSRHITEAEFQLLLNTAAAEYPENAEEWQRFLWLLWLSGLRLSEAHRLSWDTPPWHVDMDSGPYPKIIIFAEAQKSREDEVLPIPPDFAEWLAKTPKDQRRGPVAAIRDTRSRRKQLLGSKHLGNEISRFGKLAGIKTAKGKFATAHDLRRSFGHRWALKVRPVTLQRMMRHKSITTTQKYYVTITAEDVAADLYPQLYPQKRFEDDVVNLVAP